MALVEMVVGAGAIVTASAAVGTYRSVSGFVDTVEETEQRSLTHREWLAGDPKTWDENLFERVSQLEEEIDG